MTTPIYNLQFTIFLIFYFILPTTIQYDLADRKYPQKHNLESRYSDPTNLRLRKHKKKKYRSTLKKIYDNVLQ